MCGLCHHIPPSGCSPHEHSLAKPTLRELFHQNMNKCGEFPCRRSLQYAHKDLKQINTEILQKTFLSEFWYNLLLSTNAHTITLFLHGMGGISYYVLPLKRVHFPTLPW